MLTAQELADSRGRKLVDTDGDKIGKIDDIYVDDATGRPEWALVNTGLFGSKSNFVPLQEASMRGDDLAVPFTKDKVKDAPSIDADGALSPEEEADLYRHYGLEYDATPEPTGDVDTERRTTGDVDTERRTTGDDAGRDNAMTRSEEELRVGTREKEEGRVRLRKHVDTENVTETVPVKHEEVHVEREPVSEGDVDSATDGPAISEDEHEVAVHDEEVVVEKHATPKERIKLDKDTVTEQQEVSEEVRKERVEVDDDTRR